MQHPLYRVVPLNLITVNVIIRLLFSDLSDFERPEDVLLGMID